MVKANRALTGNRNATTPKVNARTPRTTNHPQLWLSSGTPVRASLPAPAWGTVADMLVIAWPPSSLLTLPEQAQQQLEQVDKIEIERQRAHHGQLVRPLGSSIGQILALQALGVPSGEPRKHQHAGDQIGRAHVELQSLMRISSAVFCLKQ